MKKILILLAMIALVVVAQHTQAQKQYPYSYRVKSALTSALTISVTPAATLTYYTLAADTNITINAVTTKAVPGDIAAFQIKANTRARTITFGTAIDSPAATITGTKTKVYLFLWNGTAYLLCGSAATD